MKKTEIIIGAKNALPICLSVIPVGISYGILAIKAGMTTFQTVLMSALVMAGSSQLTVVGMLSSASVAGMIMATFFINLRHIVMSSSVMNRLKNSSLASKLVCSFALCDESFAVFSVSKSNESGFLFGANSALYLFWILSSFCGCILGRFLPEVISKSFNVAFYASFLAMLIPNVKMKKGLLIPILLSAIVNTVLQLFLPSNYCVIIAMIFGALAGTFLIKEDEEENEKP
ncbi:MAG: AzlC family ABC transporter permease [Clostridia bacterium]|nr:AzlC family ABC transporter permease [Clostridia bacterium]